MIEGPMNEIETSSEAREFIENVFARVGARNQAILGRAALFMALGEGVPKEFRPTDSKGVTLNDEQVVGDELRDLFVRRLIIARERTR